MASRSEEFQLMLLQTLNNQAMQTNAHLAPIDELLELWINMMIVNKYDITSILLMLAQTRKHVYSAYQANIENAIIKLLDEEVNRTELDYP